MCKIKVTDIYNKNICAFLDMLAYSELGTSILAESNDGYNVIVGSTPSNLDLFHDYSKHPRKLIHVPRSHLWSTAAGRYQFIWPTWNGLIHRMKFTNFEPITQDRGAIELIREVNALDDIQVGNIKQAVRACRHIWASLPDAGYGQHENKFSELLNIYKNAGGTVKE